MSSISISSTSTAMGGKPKKGKEKKKSASIPTPQPQVTPLVGAKGARPVVRASDSTTTTAPPTPPVVNSPPRIGTMGLTPESGPAHPPGLELAKISPTLGSRVLSPPQIPQELPWIPQRRMSEVRAPAVGPRVTNGEVPKPDMIPLDVPTCKDCSFPTDVVISSSDGVHFGTHMRNLELYSGGFLTHVSVEDAHRVVVVEENSTVLSLLLRYMHLCPQPDPKSIHFGTLEQLANAVEKYLIYSAMAICKLRMESYLEQHPAEVLRYAAKNNYTDLANEAALLTIGFDYKTIKGAFGEDPDTPRRWLEFKEGWRSALSYAHRTEHNDIPHPTGPLCSWDNFRDDVLRELGSFDPSTLRKLEATFANKRGTMLGCKECETRVSEWEAGIIAQRDALPEFSTFL